MANRKIWAPSFLSVGYSSLFTKGEIEAYETHILANSSANEHDASRFFRHHPKFLYLGQAAEVKPEVVITSCGSQKIQRIDFFRRRYGASFWDIVELKHPNKPFISGSASLHARLSAEVDKAINQAQDYRDLIDLDGEIRHNLLEKGIKVWRPQIMVVVGQRDQDFDDEILQVLLDRARQRGPIEAWSYTDIYEFAKEYYEKNNVICVPTIHFTTVDIAINDFDLEQLIDQIAMDAEKLNTLPSRSFEEIVAFILQDYGYNVELTSPTRDAGIDMIASTDGPIKSTFAVQCKRYSSQNKVGINMVHSLLGTIYQRNLNKGILVTSSEFTKSAIKFLEERKSLIQGIDRKQLLEMIKHFYYKRHVRSINIIDNS